MNGNFRFLKNGLYDSADSLCLPRNRFICLISTKTTKMEAMCVFLQRHCYLCSYFDLVPEYDLSVLELCLMNHTFTIAGAIC